jgi:hypothetical protein
MHYSLMEKIRLLFIDSNCYIEVTFKAGLTVFEVLFICYIVNCISDQNQIRANKMKNKLPHCWNSSKIKILKPHQWRNG